VAQYAYRALTAAGERVAGEIEAGGCRDVERRRRPAALTVATRELATLIEATYAAGLDPTTARALPKF
jgi:hypothetical protein